MIATKLDITNAAKIQKDGLTALKNALGITATIKFLEQFDQGGTGDYIWVTIWNQQMMRFAGCLGVKMMETE